MEAKGINGTIVFDGASVAIQRTGVRARLSIGKGEKRIPITHVTAVQFKPAGGLFNGFIQFSLGGGNEKQSWFGTQSMTAANDENSVIFKRSQQTEFDEVRSAIERQIMQAQGRNVARFRHPVICRRGDGAVVVLDVLGPG